MPTIGQSASWPGAGAIESLSYTSGHGISPGTAVLVTLPRATDKAPAEFGDLVFGDGQRVVRLRDCKVDALAPRRDSSGLSWALTIFDRRWRWRTPKASFGKVSGRFNSLDPRGKLIPWSIRSPKQLAELCLKAMGETRYEIDLPEGLASLDGNGMRRYFELGENVRQSLSNPPVNWDYTPPAEALARLVELFNRRVVFQPIANRVIIATLGEGKGLPTGLYEMAGVTIDAPEKPSKVVVVGAPNLYQCRILLEPVGEEWNGSYVPINELSYKPADDGEAATQHTIVYRWPESSVETGDVRVVLSLNLFRDAGYVVSRTFETNDAASTVITNMAAVAALINADPDASALLVASTRVNPDNGQTELVLTGREAGVAFGSGQVTRPADGSSPWNVFVTLPTPGKTGGGWEDCGVGNFHGVRATDRLTRQQAQELARRTVWRCWRIVLADPATRKPPFKVPGYDKPIVRRHQILLQNEKVDQVVPEPRRPGGRTRGLITDAPGIIPAFYNGYARGAAPTVYGSIARSIGSVLWDDTAADNTDPESKVYVEFGINPAEQMVVFSAPVFARGSAAPGFERYRIPLLTLETAVVVEDADTSAPVRSEFERALGGAGGPEYQLRDDVRVAYKTTYGAGNTPTGTFKDDSDAGPRAEYYLEALEGKHGLDGGETRQYIGIVPIDPNGFIQQVSWSIGGGATTTASTNTEHDEFVLPYPARRRAENLPPHKVERDANLLDQYQRDTLRATGWLRNL